MARSYQIPGGPRIDETGARSYQIPGGPRVVETQGGASNTAINPDVGSVAITGHAPTVARTANQSVAPGVGSLTISGHAPTVAQTANQSVTPAVGALAITGYAPSITQAPASYEGTPDAGTLTITGHAPTVTQASALVQASGGWEYWLRPLTWRAPPETIPETRKAVKATTKRIRKIKERAEDVAAQLAQAEGAKREQLAQTVAELNATLADLEQMARAFRLHLELLREQQIEEDDLEIFLLAS